MLKSICNFRAACWVLTGAFLLAACHRSTIPSTTTTSPGTDTGAFEQTPVWADEFNTSGKPDTAKWSYDTGGSGWGNNELQYYTAGPNVEVKNGVLVLEARKEPMGDKKYTSTRMVSKNKGDFLYGRFEARAKLPKGRGLWPAIWMLPTDWAYGGWPRSGEIDIMEEVGFDPDRIHISIHTEAYNHIKGTQKTATTIIPSATDSFHLYRVDWTPEEIKGYIDDRLIFRFTNEHKTFAEWPFDKKFHWLLNVAVGGNWGGQKGVDDTVFPATMEIDYVRVYKLKE
ncbi:MAG TPA: glycoside hydrolase family 16 protein [Flavisolibacter sp.]|nr:glycoside hydrolase family 16 protein [Flavisolibacter sp.]